MYSKQIGSNSPTLIVILIDQSDSMKDPYADSTKASFAALAVNKTIAEIIDNCLEGLV